MGTSAGRIGGQDRYETAARVAAEVTGGQRVGAVVVASGEDAAQGVDALTAGFLAGHLGAPVLLTRRDAVPPATTDALTAALGTDQSGGRVVVLGGPGVVSDAVVHSLGAAGAAVQRVAGDDRYATAAAAARAGAASIRSYALLAGAPAARTAVLASGTSPADALSAGPLVHAARVPLLLTARDALPPATLSALRDLGIGQVVVLGGRGVVSSQVLDALVAAGLGVLTVAGATRYDTAAVLLALASAPQLTGAAGEGDVGGFGLGFADAAQGLLANGARFPDALACGPLAGSRRQPLFLTAPGALSPETAALLAGTAVSSLRAVGLAGAVPDATLGAALAAANG